MGVSGPSLLTESINTDYNKVYNSYIPLRYNIDNAWAIHTQCHA